MKTRFLGHCSCSMFCVLLFWNFVWTPSYNEALVCERKNEICNLAENDCKMEFSHKFICTTIVNMGWIKFFVNLILMLFLKFKVGVCFIYLFCIRSFL